MPALNPMVNKPSVIASHTSASDPIVKQLLAFRHLSNGWHYGDGRAPLLTTIIRSLGVNNAARMLGAEVVEAFPLVNGDVLISAYRGHSTVDMRVKGDGTYDLLHEQNDEVVCEREEMPLSEMVAYLQGLKWQAPKSSGSSIPASTATNSAASKAKRSKNLVMVRLSSTSIAPSKRATQFVTISRRTTRQTSPEAHPFSYGSPSRRYQLGTA